eukprot:TRINITY_DN8970_c0_g1_i1.p1 TRINITY_DN8970_c0_g1~~TRINITY_DN8970_c0_g1_i1.p1  ORF type:complete len:1235 (+),score=288.72 TRINITY_DN8970_c0_g1_i1:3753-7457(+)
MKDLFLLIEKQYEIEHPDQSVLSSVFASDTNTLYLVTNNLTLVTYFDSKVLFSFDLVGEGFIEEGDSITGLAYVPDTQAICISTNDGDILEYYTDTKSCDVVGTIEVGILTMAWSPDYEIVVFITGEGKILAMTQDWQVVSELYFSPDISNWDHNTSVNISWRGDGNYFAVSSIEEGKSIFRVWERDIIHHSTSESNILNQGSLISWRPFGNLIASTQINETEEKIIFFERNGLQHGEFSLIHKNSHILDMRWNSESDILTILLKLENGEESLQLWATNNYHWYLKQEFTYKTEISSILWDEESSVDLHIVTKGGIYYHYHFAWDVHISEGNDEENLSNIAVIDGDNLLLTPIKQIVMPPPMAPLKLHFPGELIRGVSFSNNYEILVHTRKHMYIYEKVVDFDDEPNLKYKLDVPQEFGCLRQALFLDESIFAILATLDGDRLVKYDIDTEESNFLLIQSGISDFYSNSVLKLFKYNNSIYVEFEDGAVHSVDNDDIEIDLSFAPIIKLENPCPWIKITKMDGEVSVISRSNNNLYIRGNLISAECNSFAIHKDYFVYTTINSKMYFMNLEKSIEFNKDVLEKQWKHDNATRELETGAEIVGLVPCGTLIVLQMPRGNLESLHPRVLTLSFLRNLVLNCEYYDAFFFCRRHRLDLNLFYDINPDMFISRLDHFVKSIEEPTYIDLFIAALRPDDITNKEYIYQWEEKSEISQRELPKMNQPATKSKINYICEQLHSLLVDYDEEKYFNQILSTLVKRDPPQIEEAMNIVRDVYLQGNTKQVNKALTHLIFLVKVNTLYKVALGMYDFDLILLVAQKSQMDPKEYMQFLAKLQKMEENVRKYNIDVFLERYDKALNNIFNAGDEYFDEALQLIVDKNLFKLAINIYKEDKEKLDIIRDNYGNYLSTIKEPVLAGLQWCACEQTQKAIDIFRDVGHWRKVLYLSAKIGEDVTYIAEELVEEMENNYQYREAAIVYETYLEQYDDAIHALVSVNEFDEAIRLCYKYDETALIESSIIPAVKRLATELVENYKGKHVKLQSDYNRLLEVRHKKLTSIPTIFDENASVAGSEASSIFSMGSTVYTFASGTTFNSSVSISSSKTTKSRRNKRKVKKYSGRKGTEHEQEYLINIISSNIPSKRAQEEVKNVLRFLVYFDMVDLAESLQTIFGKLLEDYEIAINLVNTPKILNPEDAEKEIRYQQNRFENEGPIFYQLINPVRNPEKQVSISSINWKMNLLE